MKLWEKSKRRNSFRLVVLLKEQGSEFQYLAAAHPTELRLCVVILGFGKTNTFVPLKMHLKIHIIISLIPLFARLGVSAPLK